MATGILSASRPDIPALDARSQQPGPFINPAHMNQSNISKDSQPGPSSVARRTSKSSVPGKRRRGTSPDESGDSSAPPSGTHSATHPRKNRDGPKKKKANRACAHCQKAHLTCDDTRPCQRCIKRGIADNCIEGHRKKAKYLLDDEELEQLKRKQSTADNNGSSSNNMSAPAPIPTSQPFAANDPLFNVSFDPNFSFGSEAANLEYSILSAILGNPSPPESGTAPSPPQLPSSISAPPSQNSGPTAPQNATQNPNPPASTSDDAPSQDQTGTANSQPPPPPWSAESGSYDAYREQLALAPNSPPFMTGYSPALMSTSSQPEGVQQGRFSPVYEQQQATSPSDQDVDTATSQQQNGSHAPDGRHTKEVPSSRAGAGGNKGPETQTQTLQSLSRTSSAGPTPSPGGYTGEYVPSAMHVTAAYDYTEGYHFLMKHLPRRFEKNDILRIVRALAIFRPSLIALQMPMTDEDEIFVERCFQRSLLELEKLISFSGTPTVVWRRTGEICLVAPEFCMLTEWGMDELVGKRKYIYELFENQSVVEYWENFATHAFENTTKSVYSHCVLLKPYGAPIPSTFCFTIKRDIFDLPSIVIGQWLPLL